MYIKIYIARDKSTKILSMFMAKPKLTPKYGWDIPGHHCYLLPTDLFPEIKEQECWEFDIKMENGRISR